MGMKPLERWVADHPPEPLATIWMTIAQLGRELPAMLRTFQKEWRNEVPDVWQWLGLYRDHRGLAAALYSLMADGPDFSAMMDLSRELQGASPDDLAELTNVLKSMPKEKWEDAVRIGSQQAAVFQGAMASVAFDGTADEGEGELLLEHRFAMQVVLLYVIEYGELPTRDFARARRGDLAALERIMAIDGAVVAEPNIAAFIATGVFEGDRAAGRVVARALTKKPRPLKAGPCKMLMGALIIALAENASMTISVADVRSLYDALAQSGGRSERVLIDTDLPESPEAMVKAIQRYKPFWRPLIHRMSSLGAGQK